MTHNILVVTTSNAMFDGPRPHPTGVWLSEFTEPYMEFLAAGAKLVVASPKGGAMPIDPRTTPNVMQKREWGAALSAAENTRPLAEMTADAFDAIFIPGGHGPMFDLPDNSDLARLLLRFFEQGKIISAVCHGPVGLLSARRRNGDPLVKGVTLTAYTYSEEVAAGLDKEVPFILEHRLRQAGANFITREDKADHIERDVQFITGQNPNSSISLARAVMAALRKGLQPLSNIVGTDIAQATTVAEFSPGTFLENIAIAETGDVFATSLEEGCVYSLEGGRPTQLATVERAAGIALDRNGDVLVSSTIGSKNPGIYRISKGAARLVVRMPEAAFLNGMTHLIDTRYLVADSYRGLIWEVDVEAGTQRIWLAHPALAHNADPFHPAPQVFPGVNGLKRFGPYLYASSTQQQKLLRVGVNDDGSAGEAEVWMSNINLDDFAFDQYGNLFGATHVYNSVVRIDPERRVRIVGTVDQGLAGSTAVAFGRAPDDRTSIYVTTNGGMSVPPEGGVQPGRIVKLDVGVSGHFAHL